MEKNDKNTSAATIINIKSVDINHSYATPFKILNWCKAKNDN